MHAYAQLAQVDVDELEKITNAQKSWKIGKSGICTGVELQSSVVIEHL